MVRLYLCHLFAVGFRVEWSLCKQHWVLLGGDTQLVVERMMPDLLHVVPVCDDAVLDRVLQCEDTSLALCLVADITVLLTHTYHHALLTQTTHIFSTSSVYFNAQLGSTRKLFQDK